SPWPGTPSSRNVNVLVSATLLDSRAWTLNHARACAINAVRGGAQIPTTTAEANLAKVDPPIPTCPLSDCLASQSQPGGIGGCIRCEVRGSLRWRSISAL